MKMVFELLILSVIMLLLDAVFLYSTSSFVLPIYRNIQKTTISIRYASAFACYLLMVCGMYYFIIREKRTVIDAFLLGVLVYGVYDLTVYFLFTNYTFPVAMMDMLWGGVLFGLTAFIFYNIKG